MAVRQMQGEPGQFSMARQHSADFLKAIQIAFVKGRCLMQLRQVCPLHRSDG
jgi:hypothetical protein